MKSRPPKKFTETEQLERRIEDHNAILGKEKKMELKSYQKEAIKNLPSTFTYEPGLGKTNPKSTKKKMTLKDKIDLIIKNQSKLNKIQRMTLNNYKKLRFPEKSDHAESFANRMILLYDLS